LPLQQLQEVIASLLLNGHSITAEQVTRAGIAATHAVVTVVTSNQRGPRDVLAIVADSSSQTQTGRLRQPSSVVWHKPKLRFTAAVEEVHSRRRRR
jgi:uncharacterized protein (DUF111 family)